MSGRTPLYSTTRERGVRVNMLYIFDKDGTLVQELEGRPPNKPEEQILMPGVKEKITALRAAGHEVAIASNQGGVAKRYITYRDGHAIMQDLKRKLAAHDIFYRFCPHHPDVDGECRCRKPKPGMLLDIMNGFGAQVADTIMIGNADTDRLAANAAGVKFVWAEEFFSG